MAEQPDKITGLRRTEGAKAPQAGANAGEPGQLPAFDGLPNPASMWYPFNQCPLGEM